VAVLPVFFVLIHKGFVLDDEHIFSVFVFGGVREVIGPRGDRLVVDDHNFVVGNRNGVVIGDRDASFSELWDPGVGGCLLPVVGDDADTHAARFCPDESVLEGFCRKRIGLDKDFLTGAVKEFYKKVLALRAWRKAGLNRCV